MAVEAQHLHLFATSTTRECLGNQSTYNAQMGSVENSPMVFVHDYAAVVDPSSTSCCVTAASNNVGMKRARGTMEDVDSCLVAQHVERIRAETMERRMRFDGQVVALVNDRASKRLRAKDEEMEQVKKLNWALEEKIKALLTESQVWQYLAHTNEAAANALRANLEHVLRAQQVALGEQKLPAADADAESCCGDNLEDLVGTTTSSSPAGDDWRRRRRRQLCRSCSVHEPSVLLLPCRHLCLCTTCARATDACPICKCCKTGSVNVNLS